MKMKCPHCGVSGRADVSLSGRKVKCPKCAQFFLVPVFEKTTTVLDSNNQSPAMLPEDIVSNAVTAGDELLPVTEESEPAPEIEGVDEKVDEIENPGEDPSEEADTVDKDESTSSLEDANSLELMQSDDFEQLVVEEEEAEELEEKDDEIESLGEDLSEENDIFDVDEGAGYLEDTDDLESMYPEALEQPVAEEEGTEDEIGLELDGYETEDSGDLFDGLNDETKEYDVTPDEDLIPQQEAADLEQKGFEEPVELAGKEEDFPDLSSEEFDWEDEEESDRDSGEPDEDPTKVVEKELQAELEAMLAGTCSVCGKTVDQDNSFSEDDRFYCGDCFKNQEEPIAEYADSGADGLVTGSEVPAKQLNELAAGKIPSFSYEGDFLVGSVVKEAWRMTKGTKGAIWGGMIAMLLVLFGFGAVAVVLPSVGAPAGGTVMAWANILIQLFGTVLSMVFIAGLMNIGVQRVMGRPFSWKMIFSGFSKLGSIAIAGILMTLLIAIGFFLLILPGIYLAVGYSLTLPLMLDKGLGPWDAMEASRKSVHGKWWKVFGIYLIMYLIHLVSCLPAGLGMIWTIPMFFTVSGVLYRLLFQEEVR